MSLIGMDINLKKIPDCTVFLNRTVYQPETLPKFSEFLDRGCQA